jgi:hypothetical protein
MRLIRSTSCAVLVTLVAACGPVLAQEPVPGPATSADATTQDDAADTSDADPGEDTAAAADETTDAAPASGKDTETEPATAPAETTRKPASSTGSPQRFEPTEKVRPDFDVAFPVDI